MFKLNEIYHILLALIIMTFVLSFSLSSSTILIALIFSFLILFSNIISKKLTAYYLDCDAETKIWSFQRYWLTEKSYFQKPIPIGFILPVILSILTFGAFKWLALTQYDVTPLKYRVAKRVGLYRFSELTEFHIGVIGVFGIIGNLILAALAYLFNFPDLARYSVYFAAFSMLPLGQLDGNKIFFGSLITWITMAIVVGLFLIYALFGI